jgi:hypothetical protein
MVPVRWFNSPHSKSKASIEVIREMFPEQVISLRTELPSTSHSLDLSACDYFLWRHIEANVYITRPWTTDNLKTAIQKQISSIPENMARQALENLPAWMEKASHHSGPGSNPGLVM